MPEIAMISFCAAVIRCFREFESRNLNRLVLIPFCPARERPSRFRRRGLESRRGIGGRNGRVSLPVGAAAGSSRR